jgi:hypothetical protein
VQQLPAQGVLSSDIAGKDTAGLSLPANGGEHSSGALAETAAALCWRSLCAIDNARKIAKQFHWYLSLFV